VSVVIVVLAAGLAYVLGFSEPLRQHLAERLAKEQEAA
jgi:hypothetical protein